MPSGSGRWRRSTTAQNPGDVAARAASLDAVTIDAFGTLLELADHPADRLRELLAARGVGRDREAVARAFAAEAAYYRSRLGERLLDQRAVAALQRDCVRVFLAELDADLDPDEFAPSYVGALEFRLIEGAVPALECLRAAGLTLACVSNWDSTLAAHLERLGVARFFAAIVPSAEVGAQKPDPGIFWLALERIGVVPSRALHIGNGDDDREGALAAGLAFEPAPLATLPERLGLRGAR